MLTEYRPSDLGPKRKYYSLSEAGGAALREFRSSYLELETAVNKLLKRDENE